VRQQCEATCGPTAPASLDAVCPEYLGGAPAPVCNEPCVSAMGHLLATDAKVTCAAARAELGEYGERHEQLLARGARSAAVLSGCALSQFEGAAANHCPASCVAALTSVEHECIAANVGLLPESAKQRVESACMSLFANQPPTTPPPSPLPPGASEALVVQTVFKTKGKPSDFDVAGFKDKLATQLSIPAASIELTLKAVELRRQLMREEGRLVEAAAPGRRRLAEGTEVTVTITPVNQYEATRVVNVITQELGTTSQYEAVFPGLSMEAIVVTAEEVRVVIPAPSPSPPPPEVASATSPPPAVGDKLVEGTDEQATSAGLESWLLAVIVAGAGTVLCVCVLIAGYLCCRKRAEPKDKINGGWSAGGGKAVTANYPDKPPNYTAGDGLYKTDVL